MFPTLSVWCRHEKGPYLSICTCAGHNRVSWTEGSWQSSRAAELKPVLGIPHLLSSDSIKDCRFGFLSLPEERRLTQHNEQVIIRCTHVKTAVHMCVSVQKARIGGGLSYLPSRCLPCPYVSARHPSGFGRPGAISCSHSGLFACTLVQ